MTVPTASERLRLDRLASSIADGISVWPSEWTMLVDLMRECGDDERVKRCARVVIERVGYEVRELKTCSRAQSPEGPVALAEGEFWYEERRALRPATHLVVRATVDGIEVGGTELIL